MPRKCCVYNCKTNYDAPNSSPSVTVSAKTQCNDDAFYCDGEATSDEGDKIAVYRFPRDESDKQRWIDSLPNANFKWSKDSVVCEKHWPVGYATKNAQGGHVRPVDPPSVFDVPASCVPTPPPRLRSTGNTLSVRNSQPDELQKFLQLDKFSLDKFADEIRECDDVLHWQTNDEFCLQSRTRMGSVHDFVLYVNRMTHEFEAYHLGVSVRVPFMRTSVLNAMSEATELVRFLRNFECDSGRAAFCVRQLALLSDKRFTAEDYAVALRLRSYGCAAYSAFRELVVLPGVRTMQRLVSSVNKVDEEQHLTRVLGSLTEQQRVCNLLVDEVYVQARLEYHGQVVYGEASNQAGEAARTVLTFMLACLCGGPHFCVRLLPISKLDSLLLRQQVEEICILVEKCGGTVISVVSDNNRTNRAAYALLCDKETKPWLGTSPACPSRPLYLLSDPTHLLKSVRNSWITEEHKEIAYVADGRGSRVAKWAALEKLYDSQDKLFQQARLTRKAVRPSPVERQSMSTCLQVFSDSTVAALRRSRDDATARFIEYTLQFWKICSVRRMGLNVRLNDRYRGVIEKSEPWQLKFLDEFATFAQAITSPKAKEHSQCLTRDTGTALRNTCLGLRAVTNHLFQRGLTFAILGEFSTDPLERYFGDCRQRAGGNYFISVRHVVEKHRLDRARLLAKCDPDALLESSADAAGTSTVHECASCRTFDHKLLAILPALVSDIHRDVKETLVYVAGYVAHKCFGDDDERCDDSRDEFRLHKQFFVQINRGGLTVPTDSLVNFMYYVYIVLVSIQERHQFPCQPAVTRYCQRICEMYDLVDESRRRNVVRVVTNIMLNNFTHSLDVPAASKCKRKIAKLSS